MKMNTLIQIGARAVTKTRVIPAAYDEDGNELTPERTETYVKDVPIMGTVTRDMTDAEVAAYQAQEESQPTQTLTEAERLAAVEEKTAAHDVEIEQIVTGLEALANGG
jgi:hypothetical protein